MNTIIWVTAFIVIAVITLLDFSSSKKTFFSSYLGLKLFKRFKLRKQGKLDAQWNYETGFFLIARRKFGSMMYFRISAVIFGTTFGLIMIYLVFYCLEEWENLFLIPFSVLVMKVFPKYFLVTAVNLGKKIDELKSISIIEKLWATLSVTTTVTFAFFIAFTDFLVSFYDTTTVPKYLVKIFLFSAISTVGPIIMGFTLKMLWTVKETASFASDTARDAWQFLGDRI